MITEKSPDSPVANVAIYATVSALRQKKDFVHRFNEIRTHLTTKNISFSEVEIAQLDLPKPDKDVRHETAIQITLPPSANKNEQIDAVAAMLSRLNETTFYVTPQDIQDVKDAIGKVYDEMVTDSAQSRIGNNNKERGCPR